MVSFVEMSADRAKSMKASLRAAVVVVPQWPFYAKGKVESRPPTFDDPTLVDESLEVGVVDIQCALFTDGSEKVFSEAETN